MGLFLSLSKRSVNLHPHRSIFQPSCHIFNEAVNIIKFKTKFIPLDRNESIIILTAAFLRVIMI